MQKQRSPWLVVLTIILVLTLLSMLFAGLVGMFVGDGTPRDGNVAIISITGPITVDRTAGWGTGGTASREILPLLEKADEDARIRAVLIDINSPGGSAVASDEIGQAIKNLSKPSVALIREVGASGGYWIASSADHIVANRMSITGSVGVLGSYLEFADFLTRFNVTYRRIVSGKYKDMGSPFKELQPEEQQIFEQLLEGIHAEFIAEVSANRNLPLPQVQELATGQVYLGKEAMALGLVDELGGELEAKTYLEKYLNASVTLVPFEREKSFVEMLAGAMSAQSFSVGEGIGSSLVRQTNQGLQLR